MGVHCADQYTDVSFNLTLEILIVDRDSSFQPINAAVSVSISLLRFLSLIADACGHSRHRRADRFNLTLEILIVDRNYTYANAEKARTLLVSISLLRFLSLIGSISEPQKPLSVRVSISLLRFLSLIAQHRGWDRRRNRGFNLTLEILIVDRWDEVVEITPSIAAFQSHSWDSYRWSLKISSHRSMDRWFQSHSWDSYRWSATNGPDTHTQTARFNLTLEILIVDRHSGDLFSGCL